MDTTGINFFDALTYPDEARVFVRCDFNVPLDDQQNITDDARIQAALPTIRALHERGVKLILASHLGRPKGQVVESMSMAPVGARLAELLEVEVIIPEDVTDGHVDRLIEGLHHERQIILLENLRFHPGEKKNDATFATRLASLADFYVNDAFGTAHRAHASTYGMVEHFDRRHKATGHLIRRELEELGGLLTRPERPFVAVMGGAKVSDKLTVLNSLMERVQEILIGGAMAYTFLKAQGHEVGDSRVEEDLVEQAGHILRKASGRNVRIHLPVDHVVAEEFGADAGQETADVAISPGTMGLDIGPRTRELYRSVLMRAKTVFWNGPMGVFEREPFAQGTLAVAQALADSDAKSVVGGGDSASAIRQANLLDAITHVSTGGGASLEFVEGRALPGIEALRANHPFNLG